MTVKDRILEYLGYKGMTVYAFEMSIGKTKSYLRNTLNITSDTLAMICERYPDINTEWLLRGKGEMILENYTPTVVEENPNASLQDTGLRKRLLEFIEYLGCSFPQFEVTCHLASGTVSHIKFGMSSANLKKVCLAYPQLDLYWLIGVKGHSMLKCASDSSEDLHEKLDAILSKLDRN